MNVLESVSRLHDLRNVELIAPGTSDLENWTRAADAFNQLSRSLIDDGSLIELIEECQFRERMRNLYF